MNSPSARLSRILIGPLMEGRRHQAVVGMFRTGPRLNDLVQDTMDRSLRHSCQLDVLLASDVGTPALLSKRSISSTLVCGFREQGPIHHIVVCCDGSWCGDATGTVSNIKILAECFARQEVPPLRARTWPYYNGDTKTNVRYFPGVGLEEGSFETYLLEGALALDIKKLCVEAYQFIGDSFHKRGAEVDERDVKVWLFGLSRGAFTVRSVAAMINNCGIVSKAKAKAADVDYEELCNDVFEIYENPDEAYKPSSDFSVEFRKKYSYRRDGPPVRFMGLLDTVGALGVPKINPGLKLGYEFYDTIISTEVQTVCQALATHDRLSVFEPCFVRRKNVEQSDGQSNARVAATRREAGGAAGSTSSAGGRVLLSEGAQEAASGVVTFETEEVWFPGSHYDIGRQCFVLLRKNASLVESMLRVLQNHLNILHTNITYTVQLSNPPLLYIVDRVRKAKPGLLPKDEDDILQYANDELPIGWRIPGIRPLTIDAYDKFYDTWGVRLLRHFPFVGGLLRVILDGQLLGDRQVPFYEVPEIPGSPKFFCPPSFKDEPEARRDSVFKQPWWRARGTIYRSHTYQQYLRQGPKPVTREYVSTGKDSAFVETESTTESEATQ